MSLEGYVILTKYTVMTMTEVNRFLILVGYITIITMKLSMVNQVNVLSCYQNRKRLLEKKEYL